MKTLATAIAAIALIATPAFAADMAVKAPPPAPAPLPTWTGFYGGIQFGGGWNDEAVNYSPNDTGSAVLINGSATTAPMPNGYRISQGGLVGGVEAGYNWQWSNWLLGVEADFSLSGMDGRASITSNFATLAVPVTQTSAAEQSTDWYGTVRGRVGWLATPNLLLFGTGGFAYGRVDGSASYTLVGQNVFFGTFTCFPNSACFSGSSAAIRTGWTAGGGAEWLLDQHWSAKIEYQFVDLGTETVQIISTNPTGASSFNAAFHDRFNVVRLGLNYRFW